MAAVTGPSPTLPTEEEAPPPVYEVEEEPIERRIRSVPVPKDRRGDHDPLLPEPGEGNQGS